jgi:hypothetical protein
MKGEVQGSLEEKASKERFLCRQVVDYFGEALEVRRENLNDRFSTVLPCTILDLFYALVEVVLSILRKSEKNSYVKVLSRREIDEEVSLALRALGRRWNNEARKHSPYVRKVKPKTKKLPLHLRNPITFLPTVLSAKDSGDHILMMVRELTQWSK